MSPDQPKQSGTARAPRDGSPGNGAITNPLREEPELVDLYRSITQENESQARNVLMFVVGDDEKFSSPGLIAPPDHWG